MEEEHLADSPMRRVPKVKRPEEPIQPLTPDELALLLSRPDLTTFTGLRDCAFIGSLVDTGLRLSEASSIRIADLDGRPRSITVKGKGSKPRTVFCQERVAELLRG